MQDKRVNIFMGHYGSGKTFVAVNYAIKLAKEKKPVSIYDLDIVNPYFRTVDAENTLREAGVELIVSPFAETNVDIPAMNASSYKITDDLNSYAVIDIGGDDRGALALGRFRDKILAENNYDAYMVVNCFRYETRTIEDALEMKKDIENSAKMKFTAIVNNANLGLETTVDTILKGEEFTKILSEKCGIPLAFTSVREDLITQHLKNKVKNVLPITPVTYKQW